MRALAAALVLMILIAPAAEAAPPLQARQAALDAGDWLKAAKLGATAAEVLRALQAKGRFTDADSADAVVTISPDNEVDVVEIKPLPPLPGDLGAKAQTAGLSGSGFDFGAKAGSIVLYPPDATTFAKPDGQGKPKP
jgi:hypothetical protein